MASTQFLTRALEKILGERDLKRSQHQQLRRVCEAALKEIKEEQREQKKRKGKTPSGGPAAAAYFNADKYFHPFDLACQCNIPRIINTSLDCIQKMVAYGHLRGDSPENDNPDKKLIDHIIETVCNCFIGVQTDEGVQLQIIKALLTILTSADVDVHGGTVLQAVRCCYNIFLASRNSINQTTAKACLTQIISTLFQRMENEKSLQVMAREKMAMSFPTPPSSRDGNQLPESQDMAVENGVAREEGSEESATETLEETVANGNAEEIAEEEEEDRGSRTNLEMTVDSILKESEDAALRETAVRLVERVLARAIAEECMSLPGCHQRPAGGGAEPSGVPYHLPPVAAVVVEDSVSTASSEVMEPSPQIAGLSLSDRGQTQLHFSHVLQKDCFLVFRTLCKLSMKGVTDIHDPRSHELRSKVLSLELLLSILQNSGPVFRTDDVFITAIKQFLCVALSKNGVSSVPQVFEVCLSIFLTLFSSFKSHLKIQVEVFFREIFLNILETSTSSYQHKWLVLLALSRICSDAQSVVDIYLNYDCDLSLSNILTRFVNDLSRMAQGRHYVELGATPAQERTIRVKGLECLVSVFKCMVEWSRELYVNPTLTGLNAMSPVSGGPSGMEPFTQDLLSNEPFLDSEHYSAAAKPGEKFGWRNLFHRRGASTATHRSEAEADGVLATDNPEQVETQKQLKEIMEKGIKLFADKPKKGVKFLQEKGLVSWKPSDVAKFFFTDERLDKTAVGDYLGEGEDLYKKTMYAYVDLFDFGGLDFVSALRELLSRFRLPGEAQKIDRIMEKFAARYCETNSSVGIFASADAAYVLAYSIIMLTTDLHSTQVRRKMTKEDYIKMNRGINDSKDLPREFLEGIYDEIASSEIRMREGVHQSKRSMGGVSAKKREQIFSEEGEKMAKTAQAIMEDIKSKESAFTSATHVEYVRLMFKDTWTSFLAAISVALRDGDDPEVVSLCLDGFRCAIRVACIFGLQLERDAFMKSLAKFTMLMTTTGITEMKPKNIEVIKSLCAVAYTDGNYLQSSWIDVLQCISQLELAQLIGTGVKIRYLPKPAHIPSVAPPSGGTLFSSYLKGSGAAAGGARNSVSIDTILSGGDSKKIASIQEQIGATSTQTVVVAVDKLFTGSTRLDGDAIVDFVEALCAVSNEELSSPEHPRMFSLQKIIEISYYNMGRIRLEWSHMWRVIGTHFNTVGCLPNEEVSFFVVDSLRQLAMKFVERGELANFRFQKDFLRPFEHIMKRNDSVTIRDMVVRCVAQIVQLKASNVVSGWKNIFSVFHLAAADNDQGIVELAFQTTATVFELHFPSTIDSFQDAIKCLAEFACNAAFPDTSMEAIRIIRQCANHVAEQPAMFSTSEDQSALHDADPIWVKAWFPIMLELSTIISRCKLDVRTRGLTVLFEIMKTYGNLFQQNWWVDLFKIVFRLFGNTKLPDSPIEKTEWMTTTCNHALYALMDVFAQYFEVLSPVLLEDVLSQLLWCVQQENEQLARSGTNCLESLSVSVGRQFFPDTWDSVCQCVRRIYVATVPHDLLTWRPGDVSSLGGASVASSTMSVDSARSTELPHSSAAPTPVPTPTGGESARGPSPSVEADDKPATKDLSSLEDRRRASSLSAAVDEAVGTASERQHTVASDATLDRVGPETEEHPSVVPQIEVQRPDSGGGDASSESLDKGRGPAPPLAQDEGRTGSRLSEADASSAGGGAPLPGADDTPTTRSETDPTLQATDGLPPSATMPEATPPQSDGILSSASQEEAVGLVPPSAIAIAKRDVASNDGRRAVAKKRAGSPASVTTTPTGSVQADNAQFPAKQSSSRRSASRTSSMKDELLRPREKVRSQRQGDKESKGGTAKGKKKDKSRQKVKRDKSRRERQVPVPDDNQSELSYQHPDVDMSLARMRAGKSTSALTSADSSLFSLLVIRCVVQLELIQAIDNIIFYPTVTRQDDQNILQAARVMSATYPLPRPPYSERGMFHYLSTGQLFVLLDCLEESHMFARSFNCNHEQRLNLMRAGFLGRTKPNLLRQETSSVVAALRILFRLLADQDRADDYVDVETRLLGLVRSLLDYFLSLTSESHRDAWTPVLLLLFTRMMQTTSEEFKRHLGIIYHQLCELLTLELKYEIRCLLRRVFTRIGQEYDIQPLASAEPVPFVVTPAT